MACRISWRPTARGTAAAARGEPASAITRAQAVTPSLDTRQRLARVDVLDRDLHRRALLEDAVPGAQPVAHLEVTRLKSSTLMKSCFRPFVDRKSTRLNSSHM